MKPKEISVTSRWSGEIKGKWYTFTAGVVAELEKGESNDEAFEKAWSRVNYEVDNQIQITLGVKKDV